MRDIHSLYASSLSGGVCGKATHSSRLLTMRDGVRIAVDALIPEGAAGKMPVVFCQTR